jgi:hypothetical protein
MGGTLAKPLSGMAMMSRDEGGGTANQNNVIVIIDIMLIDGEGIE